MIIQQKIIATAVNSDQLFTYMILSLIILIIFELLLYNQSTKYINRYLKNKPRIDAPRSEMLRVRNFILYITAPLAYTSIFTLIRIIAWCVHYYI